MRFWLVAVASIVLGCSLGLGITWHEFSGMRNHFGLRYSDAVTNVGALGSLPKAVIKNGDKFDFGMLQHDKSGDHTFVILNDGDATLKMSFRGVSCGKCLQTKFQTAELPPGESVDVKVQYATKKAGPGFAETLEITTNDPNAIALQLRITGYVTKPVRASTDVLTLGSISSNEGTSAEFRVLGFLSDKLDIVNLEFLDPKTAELFEVETGPGEPADDREEKRALVAREVVVKTKPGLPMGSLNQTLRMTVEAAKTETLEVRIAGTVVSDISFVGSSRLRRETNLLRLGALPRENGASVQLRILVKGPLAKSVEVKIRQIEPPEVLQASLGEPYEIAQGTIRLIPLNVEIVKNAPVVNRLGTKQAKTGKIVIETTHPKCPEVSLFVAFATE